MLEESGATWYLWGAQRMQPPAQRALRTPREMQIVSAGNLLLQPCPPDPRLWCF